MAGIKISDLPAVVAPALTDVFPIDQGAVTYKESATQLLSLFQTNASGTWNISISGNAATVTTNADLTGDVTSSGNATTYAGIVPSTKGGTGVNNGASTITLGGSLTTSGAFASTFTMTGATNVTFPTSGTLATTAGTVSSVSGTLNRITSTGGATPVIDIDANYVGQSSITTVGALASGSLAAGFTPATVPLGGTGNTTFTAYSVICAGTTATGVFQNVVGVGNAGEQLTSNGAGALPTWQASGTVSPLTTKGDLYTFTTVNARLAVGVTNGQILQVNSATATGLAWSAPTYPSASGTAGFILRSDGTNNVYSQTTYPDIVAASGFLYANGANNIAGLATANNGLPVTDNTGVPSILAGPGATGRVLSSNAAAAPSWSTSTFPTTGGAAGNVLISDGTNYIASTSLWPNTVGAVGKILRSNGTTNAYTTATYPDTASTVGNVLTSDGTNWLSTTPAPAAGFESSLMLGGM